MPIGMTHWRSSARNGKHFSRTGPWPAALPRLQRSFNEMAADGAGRGMDWADNVGAMTSIATETGKTILLFMSVCTFAESYGVKPDLAAESLTIQVLRRSCQPLS